MTRLNEQGCGFEISNVVDISDSSVLHRAFFTIFFTHLFPTFLGYIACTDFDNPFTFDFNVNL